MRTFVFAVRRALCLLLCFVMLLSSVPVVVSSIGEESALHEISTKLRTQDGNTYKVSVQFGDTTGIPADARLAVEEIPETDERYDDYVNDAQTALHRSGDDLTFTRLLDISIVDKSDPECAYQPADGTTVDVRIRMTDADELAEQNVNVVHFAGAEETPTVLQEVTVDDETVCFETDGFSAYAIVSGPSAENFDVGWERITSVEELRSMASRGLYIGHVDGFYFTNQPFTINSSRSGIAKTYPPEPTPASGSVPYFFEFEEGSTNQFKVYCYDSSHNKQYVKQNGNSLVFVAENQAQKFTIDPFPNLTNTFQIRGSGNFCWNMQGGGTGYSYPGTSGKSFAAYSELWSVNAQLGFWYYNVGESDAYNLDGRTVGLMNYSGHMVGKALMANEIDVGELEAMNLVVLEQEDDRDDKLFVSNESDITEWTFEWIEGDLYYVKADVGGSWNYLQITSEGLSLVSGQPTAACRLQVVPGSGNHTGQICLKSGSNTLTYTGSLTTGFATGGAAGSEWLNFVEMTDLTPDYLMTYTAHKISASDPNLTNGSHVIIYTRVWNPSTKRYEVYAVDHDGTLVPCYDTGDSIKWVGNRINTLLWNFVEYYWEGTNDPNYYYELYNPYSEKFIAPQISDGQILSDDPIGINLNGRRNGYYYTPIVAWDDANYSYAGLKVDDDQIQSCLLNQTADFYFAIIQEEVIDDSLTLVDTVDNNQHGITMKMIDFTAKANNSNSNPNEQDRFLNSSVGGAVTYTVPGLLSTNLGEDGYPFATWGEHASFSELFEESQLEDVNHLFIQSIYNASGYFEFDSTQNFASIDHATGDFKVYEELGTMDTGDRPTLKHGQFMPFNDLEAGYFSSLNPKNLYNALAQPLPSNDPRMSEHMYLVRNPDYYFGMELEASFVQTPNGHDAWGHDIIYEFTGDDDFWLYVDGELVIDLGGIHSALAGNVNFCTGDVYVNGRTTTLYDLFYNNYLGRIDETTGLQHTAAEAQAYVDDLFELNEQGNYVFKPYSTHTMRIFYMERGAGASNLHMRFNLASVKPGTVLLSKELGNVDEPEAIHAEYPYQIWYKKAEDNTDYLLTEDDLNIRVYYKDTITPVKYKPTLTIDGLTYQSVFILKPTEIAEIQLPDDAISYKIVECGINTDVYSSVSANGQTLEGTEITGNDHRMDYAVDYETAKVRSRVNYRNNVNPEALRDLTFRKVLYDETGLNELHNDPATFGMRLYLGAEYEDGLSLTNMASYHVKDENGVYCTWDVTNQCFAPLGAGKTDYTQFTAAERAATTFTTSMNGSISKVPAFYTIEVRELLAGTQYRVEERDYEIPDGYSLQKYMLYPEGLNGTGTVEDPAQGTIEASKDPHVDVCNLKGWGLRVNKLWSDADYMSQRGPTYFAIYTGTTEENLTLVPGTVRQLTQNQSTLYWYFQTLPVAVPFEQYKIREVELTNPTVDSDGVVTAYGTIEPIPNDGQVTVSGTQIGETTESDFEYTVLYDEGSIDSDSNVRVDTTTNNRPGIVLRKAQWNGTTPLANAQFELRDNSDTLIGTFTSDADGLITIAFLRDDVDYTLTEISTPQNYVGPGTDITLRLSNGTVTVSGVNAEYYTLTQGAGITPTLVVKNRPRSFSVVKTDMDTHAPLAGVHFALHRQVTIGDVTTIDFNPMPGYADLVTDANGVIPRLDNTLPPGTYELRESSTLQGYQSLPAYIRFTVSDTGEITMGSHPDIVTLTTSQPAQDGTVNYVMTIPNSQRIKVSIWKTDLNHTTITTGATFALYRASDFNDLTASPMGNATPVMTGETDENGILFLGSLPLGEYRLMETVAPEGFALPIAAVRITVASGSVTATQSGRAAEVVQKNDANGYWVAGQDDDTWQIRVWNLTDVPLPFIGGPGTYTFYCGGGALILLAGFLILRRRRRHPAYA